LRDLRMRTWERLMTQTLQHRPDDGGSQHLWNVGQYLSDYLRNILDDSRIHSLLLFITIVKVTGEVSCVRYEDVTSDLEEK
jgi:hypothetical protein